MEIVFVVLAWTWLLGSLVAGFVFARRVGAEPVCVDGRLRASGFTTQRDPLAVVSYVKALAWPLVLVLWLADGRPETRVLFGPAAVQLPYGDPDKVMPSFMTRWTARRS